MALIVEDGSVIAFANTYVTADEADVYHEDHGNQVAWDAADDDSKEAALIRAAAAIEGRWRGRWKGVKKNDVTGIVQALAFPRVLKKGSALGIEDEDEIEIDPDTVPIQIKHAQMEVALIEVITPFVPKTVERDKFTKKEKVGPIETEFFSGAPSIDGHPFIDQLLSGLASGGGLMMGAKIGVLDAELAPTPIDEILLDATYFKQIIIP